jgi:hypothetical protein
MVGRGSTQTAGPLDRFSMRKAIPALSPSIRARMTIEGVGRYLLLCHKVHPMHRSLEPLFLCQFLLASQAQLFGEPMEGLQEHSPILLRSWVIRTVLAPARAAAALASEPA